MNSNNIKLEIEMTNRERSDSVISDIEKALDIPIEKNKTLTADEVEKINRCCKKEKLKNVILPYIYLIIFSAIGIGIVIIVGFAIVEFIKKYVFN
jgi:hypothetical protein